MTYSTYEDDKRRMEQVMREELGDKLTDTYKQTWDNVLDTAILLTRVERTRERTAYLLRWQVALNVSTVAFVLFMWWLR